NAAYRALGDARTFYGVELEALPPARVTAFPYSITAHPMLIGNMAGYGGALLDAGFRQGWWPLAVLHVLLNFAIILMEAHGRQSRRLGMLLPILALAVGSLLLLVAFRQVWPFALACILCAAAFGAVLLRRYATPAGSGDNREKLT
ncbi:MAG: methyltransferase, partial [Geminicoccaceae bacterium]